MGIQKEKFVVTYFLIDPKTKEEFSTPSSRTVMAAYDTQAITDVTKQIKSEGYGCRVTAVDRPE